MPHWVIRQDARASVVVAQFVRQRLGIRGPYDIPPLRDVDHAPARDTAEATVLESQFEAFWTLAVEPFSHRMDQPLDLVAGFDDLAVLPTWGYEQLRTAMTPLGPEAVVYARDVHRRYRSTFTGTPGLAERGYASAIAQHERRVGRRAHPFELNVEVLPLAQRGLWWIGDTTVAVTDGVRGDVVAFDDAIAPIIAALA